MLANRILFTLILLTAFSPEISIASDLDTIVPISKKGLATFYVSGSINDFETTDFMVDTGAGYTVISEATLDKLRSQGKVGFIKKVLATLANGSTFSLPVYKLNEINIGGECIVHDIEAVVLPGTMRNILGLSALEKVAPFAISINPPQLMLSHCQKVNA